MTIRAYIGSALFRLLCDQGILEFFVLFLREHLFRDEVALASPRPTLHDLLGSGSLDSDGNDIRLRCGIDIHKGLVDRFDRRSLRFFYLSSDCNGPSKNEHKDPNQFSTWHVSPFLFRLDASL